jgi:hypothetical protein
MTISFGLCHRMVEGLRRDGHVSRWSVQIPEPELLIIEVNYPFSFILLNVKDDSHQCGICQKMSDADSIRLWLTSNVKHKLYVNAIVMKFLGSKEYGRRCAIGLRIWKRMK